MAHKHTKVSQLVILAQKKKKRKKKKDFICLNFKPFTNVINFGIYL